MIKLVCKLIAALLTLATKLYEAYQRNAPSRETRKRDEEIDQGRKDIVDGNVDAVQSRIDQLLRHKNDRRDARSEDRQA